MKRAKSKIAMSGLPKVRYRVIFILALAATAVSIFAWLARTDPAINYLPRYRRADWIVFPTAVDSRGHWFTGLDVTFRREFVLTNQPGTARLSVRAMRRAEVKINGAPVDLLPNTNWKKIRSAEVAGQFHTGTNVIEARVFNHNGPPALWLALATDQLNLYTDQS